MTSAFDSEPIQENIARGGVFALVVVPVGAVAWTAVSSIGLVTSLLAYGIAWTAVWLYRRGSGGIISRSGAILVTVIVIVTLALGFFASLVWGFAGDVAHHYATTQTEAINRPDFWQLFNLNLPELVKENGLYLVLGVVLAILGSYRILRRAFITPHVARPEQPVQPGQSGQSE